jgi:hypothetical protein
MGLSYWQGFGNGTQDVYAVPFPYIFQSHVSVLVNKISAQFTWEGDQTIRIFPAPENGALVDIRRSTSPGQRLVIYQDGAVLTEAELNLENLQNFYLVQEALDALPQYLSGETAGQPAGQLQTIVDQMVLDVLNSALLADLQSNVSQIQLLAESFLEDADRAEDSINDRRLFKKQIGTALASIAEEQLIRVTETSALAARVTAVEAAFGELGSGGASSAEIAAEAVARASADSALASRIDSVEADLVTQEAALSADITAESVARVSADDALSTQITTLTSTVTTNNSSVVSSIASEAIARSTSVSALSTSITNLSSTVGDNSANIATQATTLDGLSAQYTVKINNNGYVAGFGLASTPVNGTPSSSFVVLADKFSVVTPGAAPGETPKVPFVVGTVNGISQVGIQGSLLVDGSIFARSIAANTITANKMSVTSLSSMTANLGTITAGDITVSHAGSPYRLELGNDGSAYSIWYGSGTKNSTNAKFYLDKDGNTKFSGTLSAASGTFSGDLIAAGGTFSGNLQAAGGTFSGVLTAQAINAVQTINVAGNAITLPIGTYIAKQFVTRGSTFQSLAKLVIPAFTFTTKLHITFGFRHYSFYNDDYNTVFGRLVSNIGVLYSASVGSSAGAALSIMRGFHSQCPCASVMVTVPSNTPLTLDLQVYMSGTKNQYLANRFITATVFKK